MPETIAREAEVPVERILSILHKFGLSLEYEPLAERPPRPI